MGGRVSEMGLHDTIYFGMKASVTFREHQVECTFLKWDRKIQHISD